VTPRRDFGLEAVVAAITERATSGAVLASVAELAAATGLSHSGVQRAVQRAIDAHLLDVEHRGANTVNRYRLVNGARNAPAPTLLRTDGVQLAVASRDPNRAQLAVASRGVASRDPGVQLAVASRGADLNRLAAVAGRTDEDEIDQLWATSDPAAAARTDAVDAAPVRARPPARTRKRDPLFDAIAACWLGADVTPGKSAGALVGMATRDVRGYGGQPDDVAARWDELCRRYDEPTPAALAKHWPTLDRAARQAAPRTGRPTGASARDRAEQLRREGR
jgi:hypothetical protein